MMSVLSPRSVLSEVANALPKSCKDNVIIVGSLAAAYHLFGETDSRTLRTKDVDCMFAPRAKAVAVAQNVTEWLLEESWTFREGDPTWSNPGSSSTPTERLPLIRLNPPSNNTWFIELMGVPPENSDGVPTKEFIRVETSKGHYALCSFGFLAVAAWKPTMTPYGIRCATPPMMALANLLHHPTIGDATIGETKFGKKPIKRANKDLGRVLALAYLSEPDELGEWAKLWFEALKEKFPNRAAALARGLGTGLQELLDSPEDLDQATEICATGLLSSMRVLPEQLGATGARVIEEIVIPTSKLAEEKLPHPRSLRAAQT
jgi:hypothetical protein